MGNKVGGNRILGSPWLRGSVSTAHTGQPSLTALTQEFLLHSFLTLKRTRSNLAILLHAIRNRLAHAATSLTLLRYG
jgi:hypothetical protein